MPKRRSKGKSWRKGRGQRTEYDNSDLNVSHESELADEISKIEVTPSATESLISTSSIENDVSQLEKSSPTTSTSSGSQNNPQVVSLQESNNPQPGTSGYLNPVIANIVGSHDELDLQNIREKKEIQKVRRSTRIAERRSELQNRGLIISSEKTPTERGKKRVSPIEALTEIDDQDATLVGKAQSQSSFSAECEVATFEHDPHAALCNLAINSGHSRFPVSRCLFRKIANDTEIENDPEALQNIEELEAEIDAEAENKNLEDIFARFQEAFDKNATLFSCACCGIRTFSMGEETFHTVNLRDLQILRLSLEQKTTLETIPLRSRKAFSYFESNDEYFYHLHPEFVTSKVENDILIESATLCDKCHKSCIEQESIPKNSIAAGIDFGDPRRVNLPQLSLIEQCVISRGIAFVVIVKLPGLQIAERQPAKKGHVIVFPQPDAPRLLAERIRKQNSSGNGIPLARWST